MDIEQQGFINENKKDRVPLFSKFMKWLPLISFCVGLCAFMFQIFVLFPWHLELSREFAKLAKHMK